VTGAARLGLWILDLMREGCEADGFDVQEKAVEFGVIEGVERTGTCAAPDGEGCACDEFEDSDQPRTCYVDTDETAALRQSFARAAKTEAK